MQQKKGLWPFFFIYILNYFKFVSDCQVFLLSWLEIQYPMPKLNPGIKPFNGRGRHFVFFLTSVFFPFWALAQPTIASVSPLSGPIGTTVTITGSSFDATPANNIVYFGAVMATVTSASPTSVTVSVPAGATYEPLSLTTGGLTAYATMPFNLTFSDTGQFTPATFGTSQPVSMGGANPAYICAKDLDGDGKIDLVATNSQGVIVFKNTGTQGFPQFSQLPAISTAPDKPVAVAAGDMDGDGKPDLVVSLHDSAKLLIYLNTSTPGNISFAPADTVIASSNIVSLAIADIDADHRADIVTASDGDGSVSLYTNKSAVGNLSFSPRQDLPLTGAFPYMVVAADLDGNGMVDIACIDDNTDQVFLFQNTRIRGGGYSLTALPPIPTGAVDSNGNSPHSFGLAAGDLDGDGKIDLVVTNMYQFSLTLLQNTGSPGNISFTVLPQKPSTFPMPTDVVINDLDGDGFPDVAIVSQGGDSVGVYRNISTGGNIVLADRVSYVANAQAYWLAAADMDGDGLPDLSVVNNGMASISVLINKKSTDLSISSFTPATGVTGTVVTITGTNFTGIDSVTFGGVPASSFTVVSPTTIIATVGAGASGLVKVTTSGGFATKDGFTFNRQPQTITGFSPQTGSSGTVVLIEGTGFQSNAITGVSFGGIAVTSYTINSDTEISAVVGQGSSGYVRVGSSTDTAVSSVSFTYNTTPSTGPPVINSFVPLNATQGTDITINGTNLSNITNVTFGGMPAQSFKILSDNIIHAIVAGGATGNVSVTGPNGTGSNSGFTFLTAPLPPAPPKLTGFSPQSAASGTSVNITGINLSNVTIVTFGGALPLSIRVLSDTQVVAVVGAGTTGYVKVASPAGADSLGGFVYIPDTTQTAPSGGVFQLVQFSGAVANNQPHLSWQTLNDAGISYYAVERGIDGSQFNVIGTVPASNKTGAGHNYSFVDPNPKNGTNYYRLKMQDTATHYVYSSAIALQLSGSSAPLLRIHPNPVKYGFFLVDLPPGSAASVFQLTDLVGRTVKTLTVGPGVPQVRINVPGLPRGTYQVHWTDGSHTTCQSILIL